ncbi:hypothetical protein F4777DRAFT_580261 [Nemania sp. FL0916]|nr:hypothetical protein F4777DRAFT_580261 [Nemania sp. FL0916]
MAATPATDIVISDQGHDTQSQIQGDVDKICELLSYACTLAKFRDQHDNNTFIRVYFGAVIRYGNGARVTDVSLFHECLPYELGTYSINMPANAASIARYVTDRRVRVSDPLGHYVTNSTVAHADVNALQAMLLDKPSDHPYSPKRDIAAENMAVVDAMALLQEIENHVGYNSTFKVSREVYDQVQQRLEDYLTEEVALQMDVTYAQDGIILSLESWNSDELEQFSGGIQEILDGDFIEWENEEPFWDSQLAYDGVASKMLEEIQQRHGVLLLTSRIKREVRFFGEPAKRQAVQEDVVRSLVEGLNRRYVIETDDADFSRLCENGAPMMQFVSERVRDLGVEPKRLVFTASGDGYTEVLTFLYENKISLRDMQETDYCRLLNIDEDTDVICPCADSAKCDESIPLRQIQPHLVRDETATWTFQRMLLVSFKSYVARRPDQFRYCPTPDCEFIYRTLTASLPTHLSSPKHLCVKCRKLICRKCNASHDGQRCEEYQRILALDILGDQPLSMSIIRNCPKCQALIEKGEGCSHVRCAGCETHICWICMRYFDYTDACLHHLRDEHNWGEIDFPVEILEDELDGGGDEGGEGEDGEDGDGEDEAGGNEAGEDKDKDSEDVNDEGENDVDDEVVDIKIEENEYNPAGSAWSGVV